MWAPLLPSSHPIRPRPNEPAPATRFYTLHSTLTLPAPKLQSVPCIFSFHALFHWYFLVLPLLFYVLTPFLLHFTLHSHRPPMHVDGRTRGDSKPTVTQLPHGTSASKSTAMATRVRWGSASKWSVLRPPPPGPPILTSFAMSNFNQAWQLAFVICMYVCINIYIYLFIYLFIYLYLYIFIYLSVYLKCIYKSIYIYMLWFPVMMSRCNSSFHMVRPALTR